MKLYTTLSWLPWNHNVPLWKISMQKCIKSQMYTFLFDPRRTSLKLYKKVRREKLKNEVFRKSILTPPPTSTPPLADLARPCPPMSNNNCFNRFPVEMWPKPFLFWLHFWGFFGGSLNWTRSLDFANSLLVFLHYLKRLCSSVQISAMNTIHQNLSSMRWI